MYAAPFTTAPVEIDVALDMIMPQLENLDLLLDSIMELNDEARELGISEQFRLILGELGYTDENLSSLTVSVDKLADCFSR
ncbi:hypothetical protein ACQ4M3_39520 [Leptolyngbya sp. AN03gr2]|uniref:hypothetical protein n=1 Tax=unclassified Leptolyngbya TaxID=2650499 RepID=UPI003D310251